MLLSDLFPVKKVLNQGDALSPLLFIFTLENSFTTFQANPNELKLNVTQRLLVYADIFNILWGTYRL